jgi:hypothetical protein
VAPVDAVLLVITLLGAAPSNVKAVVSELTCQPVVNDSRRCVQIPLTALVRTALSEIQTVRSAVLLPNFNGLL